MNATSSLRRTLVALVAASTLIVLATPNRALAQALPPSDQLLITDLGVPIYNQQIFETAAAPETSLTWSPGTAPLAPINAAAVPGASIVLLTEPANEVPDPGETIISIVDKNGTVQIVSDAVISTIGNQVQAPFQVSLVSDGDPDLPAIVQFLQSSGAPWTPLPETGLLQDLTPFLIPSQFPWTVGVRSDVNVPEPSTFIMASLGIVTILGYRIRRRFV